MGYSKIAWGHATGDKSTVAVIIAAVTDKKLSPLSIALGIQTAGAIHIENTAGTALFGPIYLGNASNVQFTFDEGEIASSTALRVHASNSNNIVAAVEAAVL